MWTVPHGFHGAPATVPLADSLRTLPAAGAPHGLDVDAAVVLRGFLPEHAELESPAGAAVVAALCAVLAIAVAALYFRSLDNPLVFDDRVLMTPRVLGQYAQSMFAFDMRWFSYVTLGWTWTLAGDSLPVHRSINLILHSATCIALFMFLRAVFERVLLPVKAQVRKAESLRVGVSVALKLEVSRRA